MSTKPQQDILAEVGTIVGEINELLKKSGMPMDDMEKDDKEPAPEMDAAPEAPPVDGLEDQAAQAAQAPEGEGELQEVAGEDEASMAAEIQALSDEELDKFLEALMAEKQARSAQPAPDAAPAPEMAPAEKSMKEDYSKLGKSLETLSGAIESLNKKVDALAPKAAPKAVSKVPAASAQDVKVLHKSAPAAKRLSKSETIDFLHGEMRAKNRKVTTADVYAVNAANSDYELHEAQDALAKKGVKIPTF